MRLSLLFRDVLTGLLQPVADELQQMIGSINAWSNVEHNENGRHAAVTATDLVVSRLRFPTGQSAQRGHVVIVDDKAYGRPSLDFGDATNSTGTGYGAGFGYDNLPKGRIWVDSTSTSSGSTMYLGTTNAAPSGITNAGLRITPSGGSVNRNGTNTTTAYQFTQADGTVIANIDSTNLRFGLQTAAPGTTLDVVKANQDLTSSANGNAQVHIAAMTNDAVAIDTGGAIGMGGLYNGASARIVYGEIAGRKENATDGNASGYLSFYTNPNGALVERMRIDSTGRVGIGGAPLNRFHAQGSINGDYVGYIQNSNGTSPFGLLISYSATAPNGTSNGFVVASDNVGNRFVLRSNGGLANYQANNVDLSDARLKNIYGPAESERDRFRQLPFVRADYKDGHWETPDVMLTAQDVERIYPSLVTLFDDQRGLLGLRTQGIAMRAYKVIQELDAAVLDHERRLAALEAKK